MLAPIPAHRRKKNMFITEVNKVGLEIPVTETVIFKNGKLNCIIMNNKLGRVYANYNVKDISLHRIRL